MEMICELLLTALVAVFFSFIVAKVVAMATGGADRSSKLEVGESGNAAEDVLYGDRLMVDESKSEKRAEFVAEESRFVERFSQGADEVGEIAKAIESGEVIEAECCKLPAELIEGDSGRDDELPESDEFQVNRELLVDFPEDQHTIQQQPEEEEIRGGDNLIEENVKAETESSVAKDISEESKEIQAEQIEAQEIINEKKVETDSDDDWEGIERSELENMFAKATEFMENEDLTTAGSDLQMELYGLHKVATEGPCREQAPMPLKVAARAKCDGEHCLHCARNAWRRLGNMSPEVAMEQYVALVSDTIPSWKEDKFADDGKTEPLEVIGVASSDTSITSNVGPDYAEQSEIAEDIPSTAKNDLPRGPILESLAKE